MGLFDNWSMNKVVSNLNPLDSALFSGKGTPWAAGNTNKPEDYAVKLSPFGVVGKGISTVTGGAIPNIYGEMDYSGNDNLGRESLARKKQDEQNLINQQNQAAQEAARQQQAQQEAAMKASGEQATQQGNLERMMMDEYRKNRRGTNLY